MRDSRCHETFLIYMCFVIGFRGVALTFLLLAFVSASTSARPLLFFFFFFQQGRGDLAWWSVAPYYTILNGIPMNTPRYITGRLRNAPWILVTTQNPSTFIRTHALFVDLSAFFSSSRLWRVSHPGCPSFTVAPRYSTPRPSLRSFRPCILSFSFRHPALIILSKKSNGSTDTYNPRQCVSGVYLWKLVVFPTTLLVEPYISRRSLRCFTNDDLVLFSLFFFCWFVQWYTGTRVQATSQSQNDERFLHGLFFFFLLFFFFFIFSRFILFVCWLLLLLYFTLWTGVLASPCPPTSSPVPSNTAAARHSVVSFFSSFFPFFHILLVVRRFGSWLRRGLVPPECT